MISLIAAMSKNRVIGDNGDIPWHISEDFIRFKELTFGHPIIMGRHTYESIISIRKKRNFTGGEAIPGRKNIVLTSNPDINYPNGCISTNNMEEALNIAKNSKGSGEIFIIGGASLYEQFIDIADRIYLTLIDEVIDGDKYFPSINGEEWNIASKEVRRVEFNECKLKYWFIEYKRN